MVDDSSLSLNRIKVMQPEHTFQPGLKAYTLYINVILFAWNVRWSKSKHKENFLVYLPLDTHCSLQQKASLNLGEWILKSNVSWICH